MSESVEQATPEQANELKYLKTAHDYHSTVCHLLKTRVQFFHEEFQGIQEIVGFYGALRDQLKAKIEQIEPPVKEEKAPYVMEAVPQPEANH